MKGTWKLHLRMIIASVLMFLILYIVVGLVCTLIGVRMAPMVWLGISLVITFVQFLAGPKLVEWSMGVRRLSETEAPELHQMVGELAQNAGIPKPTVGICNTSIPNAFAYSRTRRDGHIAVTSGILNTLNHDELKAVLGHEMSHIKHYDCAINTIISVIPMICYYTAMSFLYSNSDDNGLGAIIGIIGLVFYFIGQLLVLFVSRIREYYADAGSVELGNRPEYLASALYKLVYGTATAPQSEIKSCEGNKAFFATDISNAERDITELSQIDLNHDGVIGADELRNLRNNNIKVSTGSKFMELFSTHPDMLKRIKRLSELEN